MTFTEDWYPPEHQAELLRLYSLAAELDGAIVEIGCWEGRSTIALANACEPEIVHAVDTWQGSPDEPCWELAKERDIFARFKKNMTAATSGNVKPYRRGWREWLPTWKKPIKFVHIDAQHTYEEVQDNILGLLPLMVGGGVMCGHDAQWPPVRSAVEDTFGGLLGGLVVASNIWSIQKESWT